MLWTTEMVTKGKDEVDERLEKEMEKVRQLDLVLARKTNVINQLQSSLTFFLGCKEEES